MSIASIATLDDYLRQYGPHLGRKAMESLKPLHVPGVDPLPDFSSVVEFNPDREPFEPQKHVIAATAKMLSNAGSGFICGEMGTGKTLIGMLAIHEHAKGKPYRALVLCPDHLLGMWVRQIKGSIPDAITHRFENWKGIAALIGSGCYYTKNIKGDTSASSLGEAPVCVGAEGECEDSPVNGKDTAGVTQQRVARWNKPSGAEWYVLGRNQAKWLPNWIGLGEDHRGFDGEMHSGRSGKPMVLGREPKKDKQGHEIVDQATGRVVWETISTKIFVCPTCGTTVVNKDGSPMDAKGIGKKQMTCAGKYLQQIKNPDPSVVNEKKDYERLYRTTDRQSGREEPATFSMSSTSIWDGKELTKYGRHYKVVPCKEPLWNFVGKPYRWPPARIIQKKLRGMFGYLVIDEVHEQKSDESAQSMAAGKLIAACPHTLALTGTLIGGYASHLFPLMIRMTPETLREEGFIWGGDLPFSQAYGRVDRIITTKTGGDGPSVSVGKNVSSMRRARAGGKSSERMAVRPGIMPTLFGRHMLGTSLFISLKEMADELPPLYEYVGGNPDHAKPDNYDTDEAARQAYDEWRVMWVDAAVELDEEQRPAYDIVESTLEAWNREMMKKGSMKLASTMLHTTLAYPDKPFGWEPDFPGELAVGYWKLPKIATKENWVGVVQPDELDDKVRPKEQKLIDICMMHKAAGNQCWVYVQQTNKRDVTARLKSLLERNGLSATILRANTVVPQEREEWIMKHGCDYDVVISHPKLVSTGLDLFSKHVGGHNFNTIIFYETGYNTFDMRQASRRAWRIGQPKPCYVYYLHYRNTMQHRAMMLISRKVAASNAIEGDLTVEGLAALAGEDNAQMALARELATTIDASDVQRNWGKLKASSTKRRKVVIQDVVDVEFDDVIPPPGTTSKFDLFEMELQLLAETTMAVQEKKKRRPKLKLAPPDPVPVAVEPMSDDAGFVDDDAADGLDKVKIASLDEMTRDEVAKLLARCDELGMDVSLFLD